MWNASANLNDNQIILVADDMKEYKLIIRKSTTVYGFVVATDDDAGIPAVTWRGVQS